VYIYSPKSKKFGTPTLKVISEKEYMSISSSLSFDEGMTAVYKYSEFN